MIPTFIRSHEASADVAPFRFVAFSDAANTRKISQASANTSALAGVSEKMGGVTGGMTDVVRAGLTSIELGGAVSAGDLLTADANGMAVVCTPAAGETRRYGAIADEPGVAGDVIDAFIVFGVLHEPV